MSKVFLEEVIFAFLGHFRYSTFNAFGLFYLMLHVTSYTLYDE